MNLFNMDKWEELQNVDLCLREVQLALETLKKYDDCTDVLGLNMHLECYRSLIHKKIKSVKKTYKKKTY